MFKFWNAKKSDIGLVGLGVMGENLALNIASHGFFFFFYNRTNSKVDEFIATKAKEFHEQNLVVGVKTIRKLCHNLKHPRKILLMVKAGDAVDETITHLARYLKKGDVIIDGGNSNYNDTNRRLIHLEKKGILYVGTGISGGEEGALKGPAIMPGGSTKAWPIVQDILQEISAKYKDEPCCDWIGSNGAGHYVKMIHNGIEYGDMQLIAETYALMKNIGLNNKDIHKTFSLWNKGILNSYLIEITSKIFTKKDHETNKDLIDMILDAAGQKGTGKWTAIDSYDKDYPLTLISEAVLARNLSSMKEERILANQEYYSSKSSPKGHLKLISKPKIKIAITTKDLEHALYAAKIISYAQGFALMKKADLEYKWQLDLAKIAKIWRGGCIIRSAFLNDIAEAYTKNPALANIIVDDHFKKKLIESLECWRKVVAYAAINGIPIPSMSSALSYFDGYTAEKLPANLIQAQRDFFGAHTFERIDKKRGEFFHVNWD